MMLNKMIGARENFLLAGMQPPPRLMSAHQQTQLIEALRTGNNDLAYSLIHFDDVPVGTAAFVAAMSMNNMQLLAYTVLELVLERARGFARSEFVNGDTMISFLVRVRSDVVAQRSTDGARDVGAALWRLLSDAVQQEVITATTAMFGGNLTLIRDILAEIRQHASVLDAEEASRNEVRQRMASAPSSSSSPAAIEQRAVELLLLARARDGDDMLNAIAVLSDEQLMPVLMQVVAAARRDDTAETRAFIDGVLHRAETAKFQCNNTIEPTTQESVALADDLVRIHWAGTTTAKPQCYSRAALWAQINAAADVRYYVRDPTQTRYDDEGRGYIPSTERVVRVGESHFVAYPSLSVLMNASDTTTRVFRSKIIARGQRIGNAAGNRGVSDLHGQAPGEIIHWLEPPSLFGGATTPTRPRTKPRTKSVPRRPGAGPGVRRRL